MIQVSLYSGQPVAVLGLGKAGLAACKALAAGGSEVWAWDDSEAAREAARAQGFEPVDLNKADLTKAAALVLSPGVPHTYPHPHPVAAAARRDDCLIIGEVELLYRTQIASRFIGITGTNGKSTTTALIGHILKKLEKPVQVGANLGTPALALEPMGEEGIYVLEMSSYQLELVERTIFDVAVLLNISPDHLDRHGGMDGYIAAKANIFNHQDEDCYAVIGIDDEDSRAVYNKLEATGEQMVVPVSAKRGVDGVFVRDGMLFDEEGAVIDLRLIRTLPGEHNWQNAAAAYTALLALGMDRDAIADAMRSYPGLPHRQEMVAEVDGVRFVNDSKATNADAAARALGSYDSVYWIAGGRPKEDGLSAVLPFLERVRHVYLIGEAEDAFATELEGKVAFTKCGTLDHAVAAASAAAQENKVDRPMVLLSPACASFDQFPNFEARGDAFRDLVQQKGETA